ncbi:uncharacterized protein JCM6883_002494 [Sporobolomyces salmoneus]|uniref:uncharacterized protein n=1 Tax=Sporobolomyces salmoneus TaxID=183962 RepID=UPI00316F2CFF
MTVKLLANLQGLIVNFFNLSRTVERALEVIDRVGQDVHPPKQGTIEDLERYKERIEGALLERFGKTKDSTEDIKSILREEEKKKGRDEGARGKDDELVVGKEDGKDTTA